MPYGTLMPPSPGKGRPALPPAARGGNDWTVDLVSADLMRNEK